MARRQHGRKKEMKVSMPEELALKVELLFMQPGSRKPDYGARSAFFVALVERYFQEEEQRAAEQQQEATS